MGAMVHIHTHIDDAAQIFFKYMCVFMYVKKDVIN